MAKAARTRVNRLCRAAIWWIAFGCVALLVLTGCDSRPSESRVDVLAVGVDRVNASSPGQGYRWTFVFPNSSATATTVANLAAADQVYTVPVVAANWPQAVARLRAHVSREPYVGQLQVVAWASNLTTEEVSRIIEPINGEGVIPKSFFVVATQGPAARLVREVAPEEVIPAYWLSTFLRCHICHPYDLVQYGWQWWAKSLSQGESPWAPVFAMVHETPEIVGVDVYRQTGPAARLPLDLVDAFADLTNREHRGTLALRVDGRSVAVVRLTVATRVRVRRAESAVAVHVQVHAAGNLIAIDPLPPSLAWAPLTETAAAKVIRDRDLRVIAWANTTGTDPFGWNLIAALRGTPHMAWPDSPAWTLRPIDATVSVRARVRETGVYP